MYSMRISENWRLKNQRYSLTGSRDENGNVEFPPRAVKPRQVENYDFKKEEKPADRPSLLEGAAK
jgi:hypothetical protein